MPLCCHALHDCFLSATLCIDVRRHAVFYAAATLRFSPPAPCHYCRALYTRYDTDAMPARHAARRAFFRYFMLYCHAALRRAFFFAVDTYYEMLRCERYELLLAALCRCLPLP